MAAATATKPPVASVIETPKPVASTARSERTPKPLPPSNFKPVGHFKEPQQAMLPSEWDYEAVFSPDFWTSIAPSFMAASASTGQDTIGTEIEIRKFDCSLFARLIVTGLRKNSLGMADGLYVECVGPACDPATGIPCAFDLKTRQPILRKAT